jgi:hypothetical protein
MIAPSNRSIGEGEVWLDWGKAESKALVIERRIPAELRAKIESRTDLSVADATTLIGGIHLKRGGFARDLFTTATKWYGGTYLPEDIGPIGLCLHFQGQHVRTLDRMRVFYYSVAALADGDPGFGLETPYNPALAFGRPILVGPTLSGPWCLLEGTHRLVDEYRRTALGETSPGPRDVILGVSPNALGWYWWTKRRTE